MPRFTGRVLDLLAELDDELIERARGAVVFDAPDFVEDDVARDGVAAFAEEEREDAQLARCQFERLLAAFAAGTLWVFARVQRRFMAS